MYSPRHARPSCLPVRAVVGGGLTALLLPLTMATPALATQTSPAPATSSAPAADARVATSMRISAGQTAADGTARIGVRVVTADGSPAVGEWVGIERLNPDGSWAYIGKFQTDGGSHALGFLPFSRDTRIRAYMSSTDRLVGSASPEAVVQFVQRTTLGSRAVQLASQQAGKPYRWGSTGPSSFDCSGLVTYVWKTQLGKSLPRTSSDMARATQRVAQSAKQPGDLIFSGYRGRVSHVGIYAGNGKMWAAPSRGGHVQLQPIYDAGYTVGRVA